MVKFGNWKLYGVGFCENYSLAAIWSRVFVKIYSLRSIWISTFVKIGAWNLSQSSTFVKICSLKPMQSRALLKIYSFKPVLIRVVGWNLYKVRHVWVLQLFNNNKLINILAGKIATEMYCEIKWLLYIEYIYSFEGKWPTQVL